MPPILATRWRGRVAASASNRAQRQNPLIAGLIWFDIYFVKAIWCVFPFKSFLRDACNTFGTRHSLRQSPPPL